MVCRDGKQRQASQTARGKTLNDEFIKVESIAQGALDIKSVDLLGAVKFLYNYGQRTCIYKLIDHLVGLTANAKRVAETAIIVLNEFNTNDRNTPTAKTIANHNTAVG